MKHMPKNQEYDGSDSSEDPVPSITEKYQNHPSIKLIKTKNKSKIFRFRKTDEIKKFIEKLDPKKASQKFDMSTNILKKMQLFFNYIKALIRSSTFHSELNEADIIPVHKMKSKSSVENTDVKINISKIYDRIRYDKTSNFFEDVFSKYAVFARVTVYSTAC